MTMQEFDTKILESNVSTIISQEDIDEQTGHFCDLLLSLDTNPTVMAEFVGEHYQNLNTTVENLKDFIWFVNSN